MNSPFFMSSICLIPNCLFFQGFSIIDICFSFIFAKRNGIALPLQIQLRGLIPFVVIYKSNYIIFVFFIERNQRNCRIIQRKHIFACNSFSVREEIKTEGNVYKFLRVVFHKFLVIIGKAETEIAFTLFYVRNKNIAFNQRLVADGVCAICYTTQQCCI